MRIYYFPQRANWRHLQITPEKIQELFERIAGDTDTKDLVVAVYTRSRTRWAGGTAYVRQWVAPRYFFARTGKWKLNRQTHPPDDLPLQFKLIRLLLPDDAVYPLTEIDRYGWQHSHRSFVDHIAFFFAHELHHFRRFHLGLHPGEGEQSANAWATQRCMQLGLGGNGHRLPVRKKKPKSRKPPTFWQLLNPGDFMPTDQARRSWADRLGITSLGLGLSKKEKTKYVGEKLRHCTDIGALEPGSSVRITFDPGQRYLGQQARIVRHLRRPSLRIVIETSDGKIWRWPLSWLSAMR